MSGATVKLLLMIVGGSQLWSATKDPLTRKTIHGAPRGVIKAVARIAVS